ncbi:MAG TPA: hypothetical protein VFA63_01830, partial [Pseudonocardiaceae bacterium]|nr:hypothetical protein [Pseudonocardiaceae bacterium]
METPTETETLKSQLEQTDNKFGRRALPLVYDGYKEFRTTGKYPYNADVIQFIADKHGLPKPPNGRYDHDALVSFGDPLLLNLQHEEYLANKDYELDQLIEQEQKDLLSGLVPIASVDPAEDMRLTYRDTTYRLKPATNGRWAMLPPRKRTQGVSFNALVDKHAAYERAKGS